MRLIHCKDCADHARFRSLPATEEEPGEMVRRVDGAATREMVCDGCNGSIVPGDAATAWSAWPDYRPALPEWESEYVDARLPGRPEGGE